MIAPLRRTHRRTFALLALLLPAVLLVGLAGRRPEPGTASAPAGAFDVVSNGGNFAVRRDGEGKIQAALRSLQPDALLYWSAGPPPATLPADAQLLGAVETGRTYRLPRTDGYLVLYSGGHQQVVDYARLGALP